MTRSSAFLVRGAAERDIAAIAAIERGANNPPWSEAALREELLHDFAQLAVAENDEGEIIGFCDMHIAADEAHINELGVAPEHRRKGAGSALVMWCVDCAKQAGCAQITLEVRSRGSAAVELYEKAGFKEAGRRWNFYRDPADDALVLLKELDQEG